MVGWYLSQTDLWWGYLKASLPGQRVEEMHSTVYGRKLIKARVMIWKDRRHIQLE